jgi:ABC-type glycerol-3-phosphate transport system permease component
MKMLAITLTNKYFVLVLPMTHFLAHVISLMVQDAERVPTNKFTAILDT